MTSFRTLLVVPALVSFILPAQAAYHEPVRAHNGMVASTNDIASQVGVDILKKGGNAVDAAVAVGLALAVTYPSAGNLGGGGFMMVRLADGRTTAIDYRETAPASATKDMYLDAAGNLLTGQKSSTFGYRASGVPGTVSGMALALKKYGSGKLTWTQVVEPARRLALNGFPLSYRAARSLQSNRSRLGAYPDSRKIFLNDGKLFQEGDLLKQPELAATFARLQKGGPQEFYTGETAKLIAADMAANGGTIAYDDLKNYKAVEREPLRGTYRGYTILSMPPPSSGGVILLEMLNILEGYDMSKQDPLSASRYHLLAESMRRAFADRAEYLGDPDYVKVPVAQLLDRDYAAKLRASIDPAKASKSSDVKPGLPAGYESKETTHFTVVDSAGNAVSNTYTLNGGYGSAVTAKGTGILMNNEMDDFAAKPGTANRYGLIQNSRNAVAPGKRPLSSMSPTFVLRPDGKLFFTIGSPGGPTIINTVLQVISNVIDGKMNLQAAIDTPRIHQQWLPDVIDYEPEGFSSDTQDALKAKGHTLADKPREIGDAMGVMVEEKTGVLLGAADSRYDGVAIGY